jgi:ribonuclease HII
LKTNNKLLSSLLKTKVSKIKELSTSIKDDRLIIINHFQNIILAINKNKKLTNKQRESIKELIDLIEEERKKIELNFVFPVMKKFDDEKDLDPNLSKARKDAIDNFFYVNNVLYTDMCGMQKNLKTILNTGFREENLFEFKNI